jgi:hypothetical protein
MTKYIELDAEEVDQGGPGSGNFGHAGIPGQQGGSASDGGLEAASKKEVAEALARVGRRELSTHDRIREARKVVDAVLKNPNATTKQKAKAKIYSDNIKWYERELPENKGKILEVGGVPLPPYQG